MHTVILCVDASLHGCCSHFLMMKRLQNSSCLVAGKANVDWEREGAQNGVLVGSPRAGCSCAWCRSSLISYGCVVYQYSTCMNGWWCVCHEARVVHA